MEKKQLIILLVVLLLVLAGFFFFIKNTKAPSQSAEDLNEILDVDLGSGKEDGFKIAVDESLVEYRANEVLNGSNFSPRGTTNQIVGIVFVGDEYLRFGKIRINARSLRTDSENRDDAVRKFILKSDDDRYEFIEFNVSQPVLLPVGLVIGGEGAAVEIVGDLKITDKTRPVIFRGVVKLIDKNYLLVEAETKVKRSDFDLKIPKVPFVAGVEDEILLKAKLVFNRDGK